MSSSGQVSTRQVTAVGWLDTCSSHFPSAHPNSLLLRTILFVIFSVSQLFFSLILTFSSLSSPPFPPSVLLIHNFFSFYPNLIHLCAVFFSKVSSSHLVQFSCPYSFFSSFLTANLHSTNPDPCLLIHAFSFISFVTSRLSYHNLKLSITFFLLFQLCSSSTHSFQFFCFCFSLLFLTYPCISSPFLLLFVLFCPIQDLHLVILLSFLFIFSVCIK